MKMYDKINQERKNIINKTKHTISGIPRAQKEVAELLPDLFEKKRFYKMHPRPNDHPQSREYQYYRYCISAV
jgi:hypothetical protein